VTVKPAVSIETGSHTAAPVPKVEKSAPKSVRLGKETVFSVNLNRTTSNTGVELELPKSGEYYDEPFTAYVKASRSGGYIYIMPKPKSGNGNLGTIDDGTKVTILARRRGYYFFMADDGRQGWNGTGFFTLEAQGQTNKPTTNAASGNNASTSSSSGTVSSTGVELELPKSGEYYDEPFTAYVKSTRGSGIYIMPKPKSGNGNLGTVLEGAKVIILAKRGRYYFFQTENGRQGWNGTGYFSLNGSEKVTVSAPNSDSEKSTSSPAQSSGIGGYQGDGEYYYVLVDGNRLDSDTLTLYFFGDPKSPEYWYGKDIDSAVVLFYGPNNAPGDVTTGWFDHLEATNDGRFWVSYVPFNSNKFEFACVESGGGIRFADFHSFDISPNCKWIDRSNHAYDPVTITRDYAVKWSSGLDWCYEIDVVIENGKIVQIAIPFYP
jgi:hypothetical protein